MELADFMLYFPSQIVPCVMRLGMIPLQGLVFVDWAGCGVKQQWASGVVLSPALLCFPWLQAHGAGTGWAADGLALPWTETKGPSGQEGQRCFCVGRPHGTCVPFIAFLGVCRERGLSLQPG